MRRRRSRRRKGKEEGALLYINFFFRRDGGRLLTRPGQLRQTRGASCRVTPRLLRNKSFINNRNISRGSLIGDNEGEGAAARWWRRSGGGGDGSNGADVSW